MLLHLVSKYVPTPLQYFDYFKKELICKNYSVITGEANACAKGTKLWYKSKLQLCGPAILQDTTLG